MSCITAYNKREQLYETYLKTIKGKKISLREVDVIACIVHNRGEKKIAALLLLSPRTVSAHVYNIMNKLGYNSKDQIIDFVESSEALKAMKEYYLHLLVKSNFEKQLIKIADQINQNIIIYYCSKEDALSISNSLYNSICKHLKLANIELVKDLQNNTEKSLRLDFKKITELNYYQDLFSNLAKLLNSSKIEIIIKEFEVACQAMKNIYDEKSATNLNSQKILPSRLFLRQKKFVISTSIFIAFILSVVIFFSYKTLLITKQNTVEHETPLIIKKFEKSLELIKQKQFTANNTQSESIYTNQSLIKQVEKLLDYQIIPEIKDYFNKAEMPSDILMDYLYNLQALSAYYLYNQHDGIKAQKILLHSKEISEHYVNSRANNKINFSQLTNAEVFSELQIIKDLPEIYTKIVYLLGRTYIYTNDSKTGEPYFELAKYLGDKLHLFEGYLSEVNGMLIIKKDQINSYIKEGRIKLASQKLKSVIQSYTELLSSNEVYIDNFKPESDKHTLRTPSKEIRDIFHCSNKIIEHYGTLIELCNRPEEIKKYIQEINMLLDSNKTSQGLLKVLDKLSSRKIASLYNNLGKILFILSKLKISDNELNQRIAMVVAINTSDNLQLAEGLFDKAVSISRNVDYTKADACEGLLAVRQEELRQCATNSTSKENKILLDKIEKLSNKCSSINQQLNRKSNFTIIFEPNTEVD